MSPCACTAKAPVLQDRSRVQRTLGARCSRMARLGVVQKVRNEGATPLSVRQDGVAGLTRKQSCAQHVADNVMLKQKDNRL